MGQKKSIKKEESKVDSKKDFSKEVSETFKKLQDKPVKLETKLKPKEDDLSKVVEQIDSDKFFEAIKKSNENLAYRQQMEYAANEGYEAGYALNNDYESDNSELSLDDIDGMVLNGRLESMHLSKAKTYSVEKEARWKLYTMVNANHVLNYVKWHLSLN